MLKKSVIALVTVLALAGCASKGAHDAQDTAATPVSGNGMNGANAGQPVQIGDQMSGDQGTGLFDPKANANVIYFALDSSEINASGQATVDKFAKYLVANPVVKVRIEGNTDERGTREYNMSLGERRANAVLSALSAKGVAAGQMSVISFGEEHPVAMGHDEASWSQNRRAVIARQ